MKKVQITTAFAVLSGVAWASAPVATVVRTTQGLNREVVVEYTLTGEPGVVTPSVQTNSGTAWIDIGDENLTCFSGDVNKLIDAGETVRKFVWRPDVAWPNQRITDRNFRIGVKAWATDAPPPYMVVDLVVSNTVRYYSSAAALPDGGIAASVYKTDRLVLRRIPSANVEWRMGSPANESGRWAWDAREDQHLVTLSNDWYLGVFPVTQRQYQLLMNARPSNFSNDDYFALRPVEKISYEMVRGAASSYSWPANKHNVDPARFLGKLRGVSGVDDFDLPLEALWEFACRAGSGMALYGDKMSSAQLAKLGRYKGNGGYVNGTDQPAAACSSANGTAAVGSYEPNDFGLYDMLGNVSEWCIDWFAVALANVDPNVGPSQETVTGRRVLKGGAWSNDPADCRCASRSNADASAANYASNGFRVSCSARAVR